MQNANSSPAECYRCGQECLEQRRIEAALRHFDNAERLGFEASDCAASRWDCWMLSGQFERAWAESDRIAGLGVHDPHRLWEGQPWDGKRIMLRCLHGLGDTIQLVRYAPLLRATCASLTVQTHPQLTTLIEGVEGIDRVVTWGPEYVEDVSAWDIQIEINELPRAFRTTLATIPSRIPYIRVPETLMAWAAQLLPPRSAQRRVGLCWQAGPWDPCRSVPVDALIPLTAAPRLQFFNLQKGVPAPGHIQELEANSQDVRDTAALILNLDLVITVDTMTAHLAGALGKPVWILLPFSADWRWMLDRTDTPWYPTARLFRQTRQGDWQPVIRQLAEALDSYEW